MMLPQSRTTAIKAALLRNVSKNDSAAVMFDFFSSGNGINSAVDEPKFPEINS